MIAGLFSAIVTILICYFLSKVVGQVIRMQVAFWSKILFR